LPNIITTTTTTTTSITTHRTWTISPLLLPDTINRTVDMFKKAEMKLDLAITTHHGTQYFSRASHPTLPNQHNL
jgi:pyruvate kinase